MVKFAFLGTPPFAAQTLSGLVQKGHLPTLIITQPDRPGFSRRALLGSGVCDWARVHLPDTPLLRPSNVSSSDSLGKIKALGIQLLLVVAYGQILRPSLLDLPPLGSLNAHASLLPKWRGAAPIQRAILAGDEQTGVTLMRVAPGLDAGDIVAKTTCAISSNMTAGELEQQLCPLASHLFSWALDHLRAGQTLAQIPQVSADATYAAKLTKNEAHVSWDEGSELTHRRIRAVSPRPGAWCLLQLEGGVRRLNVADSLPLKAACWAKSLDRQGCIGVAESRICFRCGDGLIGVSRLQLEGGRWLTSAEFAAGYGNRLIGLTQP